MSDQSDSGEKACTKCGEVKPLSEYHRKLGGLQSRCKICKIEDIREWRLSNPAKNMLRSARCRAKRYGTPFTLTLEDVSVPEACPCCKLPMEFGSMADRANSPSLDQIIPRLGYTRENCIVICFGCNTKKSDSSPEQLYAIADYIYQIRKERGLC